MSSSLWGLREKINGDWHLRTKTNTYTIEKKLDDLIETIENDKKSETIEKESETKQPNGSLEFSFSPMETVSAFDIGVDGKYYSIGTNSVGSTFKKYDEIVDTATVVETGISWNRDLWGNPHEMFVMSDGIVVFANNQDTTKARIYHMDDMQSQPTLVYESDDLTPSFFALDFGIKRYSGGISSIILAGVYGREKANRDLLMSLDNGKTFTTIKQTKGNHATNNSHWHDVAIDPYHGFLWAVEGDGDGQRGVHFSDDLGVTWRTLTTDSQPTAIIPFPERVVFGRDDGKPGLSYFEKPLISTDYDNITNDSYKVLREFLPTEDGYAYYGSTPVFEGAEAYMHFTIYPQHEFQLMMGTGDFGKTWHFVHLGFKSGENNRHRITKIVDMDDKYVYAWTQSSSLVYAKRLDWV